MLTSDFVDPSKLFLFFLKVLQAEFMAQSKVYFCLLTDFQSS